MVQKLKSFIDEARQEFKRVNWPTRAETMRMTGIVIGVSLAIAIFLGALDLVFVSLLTRFVL